MVVGEWSFRQNGSVETSAPKRPILRHTVSDDTSRHVTFRRGRQDWISIAVGQRDAGDVVKTENKLTTKTWWEFSKNTRRRTRTCHNGCKHYRAIWADFVRGSEKNSSSRENLDEFKDTINRYPTYSYERQRRLCWRWSCGMRWAQNPTVRRSVADRFSDRRYKLEFSGLSVRKNTNVRVFFLWKRC